jgi:Flp pilus assembly pilin Flp
MQRLVRNICRSEKGQTTVEYALIVTFVIGLAAVSMLGLEDSVTAFFTAAVDRLDAVLLS